MLAVGMIVMMAIGGALNPKALTPTIACSIGVLVAGTDDTKIIFCASAWILAYIISTFRE